MSYLNINKTLVIGDIHLNEVHLDFFLSVLFPFITNVIQKYNPEQIIFLGDIFDAPNINNATASLFKKLLSLLGDTKIIIINGNHDKIDRVKSVFDVLILPTNVTFYKDVCFVDNYIFIPHIDKRDDHLKIFNNIKEYITNNKYEEIFLFSHNDFNEIYKFKNNFFNITNLFHDINIKTYLINGHNHVSFFKKVDKLFIFNLGCSINTNFGDTVDHNKFLIINNTETNFKDKFLIIENKYSVQYKTLHIWKEDQLYGSCANINKDNYTFVKFIIHDPSIKIDNNLKDHLQKKYNILDIIIDYSINEIIKIDTNLTDSTSLSDLCNKLNISIDEFITNDTDKVNEKLEILLSLLNIMFENRNTSPLDIENVTSTVKKYLLNG
jgi:DNA repair exonuclease SbcCD nuclease subunit